MSQLTVGRTLYSSSYWQVQDVAGVSIVLLRRLAGSFPNLEIFHQSVSEVVAALAGFDRSTHGLVFDSRLAVMRHEPEFQEAMTAARPSLLERWAIIAMLLQSDAGRRQITRHRKEAQLAWQVFSEEQAALRFVCEKLKKA